MRLLPNHRAPSPGSTHPTRLTWLSDRRAMSLGAESGYILGTVLAAMAVGLIIITALLGLSFSTHRAAITQQQLAQERRAADGALEASVEFMRNAPEPGDPCEPLPATVPMDTTADGIDADSDVHVECASVLDPSPNVSGDMRVIASEPYTPDASNPFSWVATGSDDPDPAEVNLIHQGSEPVSFVGDVLVKNGSAVNGGAEVGAEVSGHYFQGDLGTGGSEPGVACGVLSESFVPSSVSRQIRDADDGEPVCNDAAVAGLTRSDPSVPLGLGDTSSDPGSVSCDALTFSPGYYGNVKTQALNGLLSTCTDATFHFTPGDYWFDAHTDDNFELRFGATGANYVFGEMDSSGIDCDPLSTSNTSVTIGPSTTLKHTKGNLSICAGEDPADPALPALAKSDTAADDDVVGPTLLNSVNGRAAPWDFSNPGNLVDPNPAAGDRAAAILCNASSCGFPIFQAEINSTGSRPVTSLKFRWSSLEYPVAFGANRQIWVRLKPASGSDTICETMDLARGRTNGVGSEVDLLEGCADAIKNEEDLQGLRLEVEFGTDALGPPGDPPGCIGECPYSIQVWGAELVVNEIDISATIASSPPGQWSDFNKLLSAGGGYAAAEEGCAYDLGVPWGVVADICARPLRDAPLQRQEFTISGFELPGHDPQAKISSLELVFDNHGGTDVVANPTLTHPGLDLGETMVMVTVDGDDCEAVVVPGYTRSLSTYTMDMSNCSSLLASAAAIEDASITVSILPERNIFVGADVKPGLGVEIQQIDHVRLVGETGEHPQVQTARITIDEASGDSVRVYGDSDFQLLDLDVDWAGTASFESIFNGSLVVNSLASRQTGSDVGDGVGVICCGPKFPNALLTATMNPPDSDEPIRGVARVFLDPSEIGVHAARIADWQLCHLDGCQVDAVPTP